MDPITLDIPEDALCRTGGFDWTAGQGVPIGLGDEFYFVHAGVEE